MKIQCDVCGGAQQATIFCCADEAALCGGCDRRVHHANKLAGKHRRFSLRNPTSPSDSPRCDICQERRAILFCQEDRAILCSECDSSIHTANPLTQKHNRFLLTGVRVSSASPSVITDVNDVGLVSTSPPTTTSNSCSDGGGGGGGSSISDYLIKTLPGWCVEDLLDSSDCLSKMGEVSPFIEADFDGIGGFGFGASANPTWVPKVPQWMTPSTPVIGTFNGSCNADDQTTFMYSSPPSGKRRANDDGGFRVPQISPPTSKRFRSMWTTG
ncbi:putative salt tolerance-like protein [Acorus calamus]|uniref:Salt tolerance-like protein n=1 Tax=Acorus calamus TaxID=4465 RepID=A0AAV9FKH4_ACOCL|nr:putative salt tolerance-like protein [Acorus calamus]